MARNCRKRKMACTAVRRIFNIRALPVMPHCSAVPAFSETTSLTMGNKAFPIWAWSLLLNYALGEEGYKGKNAIKDSIAEASVSRLYRSLPVSRYASAAPHAAYSFHVPNVLNAPQNSRVIPVNEESFVLQTPNGYLSDSYGNRFAASPQMAGLKTTFPQQFLQLQDLPVHLSQPLVAAPNFHLKHTTPHFFAPAQFGVQRLQASSPAPFARYAAQPIAHNANTKTFAASPVPYSNNQYQTIQQQQSRNKAIFVNTQAQEHYNRLKNEPKFQRLQENPKEYPTHQNSQGENDTKKHNHHQDLNTAKRQQLVQPAKETEITTYVNGKKSVVTLETKPPLPLLDISLLEPLTFDNPLVPQVQHFLPRINEATYHKLPEFNVHAEVVKKNQHESGEHQTRSHDDEIDNSKSRTKHKSPKTKQHRPHVENDNINNNSPPTITVKGVPNVSPEYSYEINSPNYKETYKEQVVSYNKETQSEPVNFSYNNAAEAVPVNYSYKKETQSEPINYTYERQVKDKPVHYTHSYVHSSQAPQEEKQVYYENEGQGPKHLTYTIKSGGKNSEQNYQAHKAPQTTPGELKEYSTDDDTRPKSKPVNHNIEHEEFAPAPQTAHELVPEHREQEHQNPIVHDDLKVNNDFPKSFTDIINAQFNAQFKPITPSYDRNEDFVPKHKPHEQIRVDPNQHVQRPQPGRPSTPQNDRYSPNQHIHEKSKHIIIRDETPDSIQTHNEKQSTETVDQEENNEENFEKDYKNAAFGFPAYEARSEDVERDIFNPETYGAPRDDNYDNEHIPFEQYYQEGDKFPKFTHSSYKDGRDKIKEDYYVDFSINKPESMLEMYKNKAAYYKMYKDSRPEKILNFNQNAKDNRNAKFTVAPTYLFNYATEQKPKQHQQFARLQIPSQFQEFNYEKEAPRDNAAYGSQPFQRLRTKTQFVEPQFQYGFEPSIPHLLDSELATMASNNSPESEKPGTRKKMYKENWYIKKTSTSGGNAGSK